MDSKKWYKSWTIWVNLGAAAGLGIVNMITELSPDALWAAPVLAVLNFALRFKTTQPVA